MIQKANSFVTKCSVNIDGNWVGTSQGRISSSLRINNCDIYDFQMVYCFVLC